MRTSIKVNLYAMIADAVERGLEIGYNRSRKHVDDPDDSAVRAAQHDAIMSEITEYLNFGDFYAEEHNAYTR